MRFKVFIYVGLVLFLYTNIATAQYNIPGGAGTKSVSISFNIMALQGFINPPYVSGVINDPTDPASTTGIKIDITENSLPILAANYSVTAISSNASVVTVANVLINKFDGYVTVKIIATGVGYSDIKLKLTRGSSTDNITIKYAASVASVTPNSTIFHTGSSDASAAIALDSNYMLIGDDEINSLFVYDRKKSGLPVKSYDYQNLLGLTDGSAGNYLEIDLEAGVKSTSYLNRIYWISSLGTSGSSNVVKPNINRFFATDVTGTGSATTFTTVGYYNDIRNQLITWGNSKGYNFTTSAASGHDAKAIDGFNVEGMCFAPDNTSLYIGFRSPLVPISARTKALIAPILNFETWFNNGTPIGNPIFGNSIELNLGGRGFRDIIRLSNGVYIIIAGNYAANPLNGAIYKWTGIATDAPVLIPNFNIANLNAETVVELSSNGIMANNKLQIISDNGSTEYYNDGTQAKDLSQNNFKKFRSDILTTSLNVLPVSIIYFRAAKRNEKKYLQWKINQTDVEKIELEQSINGQIFNTVNTFLLNEKDVEFFVPEPEKNIDYYRLKITLKNGEKKYSQILSFKKSNPKLLVSVYPNPASTNFFINTNNYEEKKVIIYNALGEILFQNTYTASTIFIKNNFAAAGILNIRVITKNEDVVEKIYISEK